MKCMTYCNTIRIYQLINIIFVEISLGNEFSHVSNSFKPLLKIFFSCKKKLVYPTMDNSIVYHHECV